MNLTEFRELCGEAILAEGEHFVIKIAETEQEITEAFQLRYKVFKSEQGRLANMSAELSHVGIDTDDFDKNCLHLIVQEKSTKLVVGTYRVQAGCTISDKTKFYSSQEYSIDKLESYTNSTLEYGRSCVDPDYRNGTVVSLLWSGIGALHTRTKMRYMLGCVSLETVDPMIGWAVYQKALKMENHEIPTDISGSPQAGFELPFAGQAELDKFASENSELIAEHFPPLLKGYLRLGAHLAGVPVLDRAFGSIDMLIFLDVENMPSRYRKHYFG